MIFAMPPMSNVERQRKFRKSHPGYFKKYKRSARRAAQDMEYRQHAAKLAALALGKPTPTQPQPTLAVQAAARGAELLTDAAAGPSVADTVAVNDTTPAPALPAGDATTGSTAFVSALPSSKTLIVRLESIPFPR